MQSALIVSNMQSELRVSNMQSAPILFFFFCDKNLIGHWLLSLSLLHTFSLQLQYKND